MVVINYVIEGVIGEWLVLVCLNGVYENVFFKEGCKCVMKWFKFYVQYDDVYFWEVLEIICILVGINFSVELCW